MDTIRRALAPVTFVVLMALLFASVFLGGLLGPTLLLLTPAYLYLGGGVARFAFTELARGRLPASAAAPITAPRASTEDHGTSRGVAPVIA